MITIEQASEAERLYKWCHDLEKSEPFKQVVLAEIAERAAEHDRCGTDITKKPRIRAEHHRALKLARELLELVPKRRAEALETLRAWKEQNGEPFVVTTDGKNV